LKRCQISDEKLGQNDMTDNIYAGAVNQLPRERLRGLLEALPMGFLDDDAGEAEVNQVSSEL
jgi:fructose-1,6-bisphosphatase